MSELTDVGPGAFDGVVEHADVGMRGFSVDPLNLLLKLGNVRIYRLQTFIKPMLVRTRAATVKAP